MKFISSEAQKKLNQQLASLQQQVQDLTLQQRALQNRLADQQADFERQLAESANALDDSRGALAQAQDRARAELQNATQEREQLLIQLADLQKTLHDSQTALNSSRAAAKAETDAKAKADKALAEQKAKAEQLQAELTKAQTDAKAQVDKVLAEQKAKAEQLQAELTKAQANAKAQTDAKAQADKALADQKAKAEQLQAELTKAQAEAKNQADAKTQADKALAEQKTKVEQLQAELTKAQAEAKNQTDAKAQADKALTEQKAKADQLQTELAAQSKKQRELQAKYDDTSQENELLLLQLMQAQEELVEYYEEKNRFEKLYEAYKARWERLEQRYPNYVDYGAIELTGYDNLSDVPSVTWRVKDYAQGGVALPEFMFSVALQDGHPGIGLVQDEASPAQEDSTLVPKLLATRQPQAERFLRMGNTEQRQLTAALTILAQLEAAQWQGLDIPQGLDMGFWRPFFKQLATQWVALPAALRYDTVKLKRELINPDYEHLWLELHGVSFGQRSWKKLEVRLGAALVQPDGFSLFPKFEIPLIDGKHKPFESWYAESHDDAGAKLELRFSLEKNVFDAAVLGKLAEADRLLVLRLVYAMPAALQQLQDQHAAIHRPWATWIDFARSAVQVLEQSRLAMAKAAKTQSVDASTPPVIASEAKQSKTPKIAAASGLAMTEGRIAAASGLAMTEGKGAGMATPSSVIASAAKQSTTPLGPKVISIAPVPKKPAAKKTAKSKKSAA